MVLLTHSLRSAAGSVGMELRFQDPLGLLNRNTVNLTHLEDDKCLICMPGCCFSSHPFGFSLSLTSAAAVIAFSILDSTPVERQPGEVKRDCSLKTAKDNLPRALRITISCILPGRLPPISSSDCRHQSPADAARENINLCPLLLLLLFMCVDVRGKGGGAFK